jgi:hypothetical protein
LALIFCIHKDSKEHPQGCGAGSTLGVRFPRAKLDASGAASKLVEYYRDPAVVHRVVFEEPGEGSECAVKIVNTNVNPDRVAIIVSIFAHDLIRPRAVE